MSNYFWDSETLLEDIKHLNKWTAVCIKGKNACLIKVEAFLKFFCRFNATPTRMLSNSYKNI